MNIFVEFVRMHFEMAAGYAIDAFHQTPSGQGYCFPTPGVYLPRCHD